MSRNFFGKSENSWQHVPLTGVANPLSDRVSLLAQVNQVS